MIIYMHHLEFQITSMFACGVISLKTDDFLKKLGLKPLNTQALVSNQQLNNLDSILFYNNSFSKETKQLALEYKNLWDNKLILNTFKYAEKFSRLEL